MRKGCFLTLVITITVAIGSLIFIYRQYGSVIKNYAKEKIFEIGVNDLKKDFDNLQRNNYDDSLRVFFFNRIENLKKKDFEESMKNFEKIAERTKMFIEDGVIDSLEFNILKKMIDEDERREKN
ncbi:hypothetical protein MROS_2559 [Melioribacter roseus P3M-2]|uniref:Uncharacterized protein n=1 Tax=Melioribacter roseus (strain DSM 23840 / JCM 17771 / VKM B-2668 / P3M-2) TaxID=1191523 RepID=I6ZUU3_MELRP|nr:hypothetical protein [Melioribacter roseus]AFN75789.1 hypothetical protein MROS_2559 [Melioribacter roseus P3M-2]